MEEVREAMPNGDQESWDQLWDRICQQYEASISGRFIMFNMKTFAEEIEDELRRHGINFSWEENDLFVPLEYRSLIHDIVMGIEGRNVITPGSFGEHIKKG